MEQRTLTERLERIEKLFEEAGIIGYPEEGTGEAARKYRDEQIRYEQMSSKDQASTEAMAQQKDIRFQRNFERRHTNEGRAATAPIKTAFDEIADRIATSTDRISMIAGKLEEIAIRILGPLPEEANAPGAGGVSMNPEGTLDTVHIALNWLDQSLCRLHQAAVRLEHL